MKDQNIIQYLLAHHNEYNQITQRHASENLTASCYAKNVKFHTL